jgi:hypothetical protein
MLWDVELANEFGTDDRDINELLVAAGFLTRAIDYKQVCHYLLTKAGANFGTTIDPGRSGNGTDTPQVKWHLSVSDLLKCVYALEELSRTQESE